MGLRILFLADGPRGPVVTGDRLRNWNLVSRLARRHRVEWWALQEPGAPDPGPAPPQVVARDVRVPPGWKERSGRWRRWMRVPFAREPLLVLPPRLPELERQVAEAGADADIIHCSHLLTWCMVPPQLASRCVVDMMDSMCLRYTAYLAASPGIRLQDRALMWYSLFGQARRLRAYERSMPQRAGAAVMVAPRDRDFLDAPGMHVVPNGVDLEMFRAGGERVPGRLVFFGNLRYRPNADAAEVLAREVLPAVRVRVPGAHVRLVGAEPGPEVRALGELPGVTVVGPVERMGEELARAEVFACPMRMASGLQNKVLEALAAELPTVVTPSAAAGLDLRAGTELLVCPPGEEFAAAVVRLLGDADERGRLARAGRAAVAERYGWDGMVASLERIYEDVVARARAGSRP